LLLHPASDFVSRFVGVDRGLKRLSLLSVADVHLERGSTAHVGDALAEVRRLAETAGGEYVLVLDHTERPHGWAKVSHLPAAGTLSPELGDASSPVVTFETTLRDALAMLLASAVQTAVVVDESGRYTGVVTLDALGVAFRAAPEAEAAEEAAVG
jgi:osmoprotectant transport system ATP-binding protein